MINKRTVLRSAIIAATLAPTAVMASGYKINEQSASGVGNAYAGRAAVVEDASVVFYNPAGMVHLERAEITVGASYLSGDGEFKGSGTDVAGQPISGGDGTYSNGGDFLGTATIPFIYYAKPINKDFAVGLGIFTPFGTNTDYDSDFVGGGFADQTQLKSIEIQPTISLRINDEWSVGAGLDIVYMKGLLSKYVDTVPYSAEAKAGYDAAVEGIMQRDNVDEATAQAMATHATGYSADSPLFDSQYAGFENYYEVKGDDWGTGFNFGLMWKPSESTTFGFAYRSEINVNLEGQSKFENAFVAYSQGTAGTDSTAAVPDGLIEYGKIREQDSRVPLTTPQSATFSVAHQATKNLLLQAGATWTGWSSFEYFDVIATENTGGPADGIDINDISASNGLVDAEGNNNGYIGHIVEEWKDVWAYAVGASYQATNSLMLRAGYAYDQSPVRDQYRTARVPSSDRQWVTAGFQYKVNQDWTVDMGAAYLFMDKMELSETNNNLEDQPYGNASVEGEYEIDAFGVSMQVSYKM